METLLPEHTGIKCLVFRHWLFHGWFVQGLIFVVDSNDRERIGEAKDELNKMVKWQFCKPPVC